MLKQEIFYIKLRNSPLIFAGWGKYLKPIFSEHSIWLCPDLSKTYEVFDKLKYFGDVEICSFTQVNG